MKEKRKRSYRRATYPSALRMAKLVDEMPRHGIGVRVKTMAERLEISVQSLRRYVKAMEGHFVTDDEEPEFVIEQVGGDDWLKRRSRQEAAASANIYHLVSVYLSLEIFKMLGANSVFATEMDELLQQIETCLPGSQRELLKDLPRKFFTAPYMPKDYTGFDDILNTALKAIVYQKKLKLARLKNDQRVEFEVEPYTLLLYKGGLYLVARPLDGRRPLYFSIDRLLDCAELPEKFDYPKDYHPEQMIEGAFGIFGGEPRTFFKLKFPPELAQYISERKWHKSQKLESTADGSLLVTLRVFDSDEIRAWIRSFGSSVEVLEPR